MMLTYHISHKKFFSTALYVPGRSGVKTHVVKTKHIKMRRDTDELFASPEHSAKCSYEVLTHDYHVDLEMNSVNRCIWK